MPTYQMFSQNRWPASSKPNEIGVRRFAVNLAKGVDSIDLHHQVVTPLVEFIQWFDANIEKVDVIHGYSWREIAGKKGTGRLSNHASGTAIDINPDRHPIESAAGTGVSEEGRRAVGTFSKKQVAAILAKTKELGLRWGGTYPGRKDEMHFEWVASPPSTQIAKVNTHYVPPRYNIWYQNPWFYALAGVAAATLIITPIAISRSRSRK